MTEPALKPCPKCRGSGHRIGYGPGYGDNYYGVEQKLRLLIYSLCGGSGACLMDWIYDEAGEGP